MVGLTNKQLEELGNKIFCNEHFLGVYPADSMPQINNFKKTSIIFNLSKHNEPGTHYVAVLFYNNNIFYFDSYGKPLTTKILKQNLAKFKLPIYYHKRAIQHKQSIYCSFFSLAYLKARLINKMTPTQFFSMFNSPSNKQNDKIVFNFLLKK